MRLNCDLGESFGTWQKGQDAEIMPFIDLANIACGFHASDAQIMTNTVALAIKHQVIIGAHPSYPDLAGFGRRSMTIASDELAAMITYQIGALQAICTAQGTTVSYVKPHGALYNDMMKNHDVFSTVCRAISTLNPNLTLMMQAMVNIEPFKNIADKYGINLWFEAFADRNYQANGLLVPRNTAHAVIENVDNIVDRCNHLLTHKSIISNDGNVLDLQVDTLCVHGDTPNALEIAQALSALLIKQRTS